MIVPNTNYLLVKMLVFEEKRKPDYPEKNHLEQGENQTRLKKKQKNTLFPQSGTFSSKADIQRDPALTKYTTLEYY